MDTAKIEPQPCTKIIIVWYTAFRLKKKGHQEKKKENDNEYYTPSWMIK